MIKINNFRGDLSDISARTATLLHRVFVSAETSVRSTPPKTFVFITQNDFHRIKVPHKQSHNVENKITPAAALIPITAYRCILSILLRYALDRIAKRTATKCLGRWRARCWPSWCSTKSSWQLEPRRRVTWSGTATRGCWKFVWCLRSCVLWARP